MYQKRILFEKLREAAASVLPISAIVVAICFFLVPVDAGLMLSFVSETRFGNRNPEIFGSTRLVLT